MVGLAALMAADFATLFRTLASFSPARVPLQGAPWEAYVDWALSQGLAPLAAYNLEYRLAGGGAPEWARDRLLSLYQGSVNDNVMKLVNFKRAVDELEGRKVALLHGAALVDTVYPHVGFRPVLEISLLLRAEDVEGFANYLSRAGFRPQTEVEDPQGAAKVVSDGNTQVLLFTSLGGDPARGAEADALSRATPTKVYGPSLFRLELEDAVLATCLSHARAGYDVPVLSYVDLRELLTGASSMSGPYSRPVDGAALRERAERWGASRALYASASIVGRLFPEVAPAVERLLPEVSAPVRLLLDAAIVQPLSEPGRQRDWKLADRVRRVLTGAEA